MNQIARYSLVVGILLAVGICTPTAASASPASQIVIPSTDTRGFLVPHLDIDSYPRLSNESSGTRRAPIFDLGLTAGILPFETVHAEVGLDLIYQGDSTLDKYPVYFNFKLATIEDSICKGFPALAAGMYNIGIKPGFTTQDIGYGLVARTFPYVGRFSVGYFMGNGNLFVNESGGRANHGVLASWDRTMKEISEKLWLGVDYQGSQSSLGSVNLGISWAFAKNVIVLFGYDHYLHHAVAGKDTFTVQVDIDFW